MSWAFGCLRAGSGSFGRGVSHLGLSSVHPPCTQTGRMALSPPKCTHGAKRAPELNARQTLRRDDDVTARVGSVGVLSGTRGFGWVSLPAVAAGYSSLAKTSSIRSAMMGAIVFP